MVNSERMGMRFSTATAAMARPAAASKRVVNWSCMFWLMKQYDIWFYLVLFDPNTRMLMPVVSCTFGDGKCLFIPISFISLLLSFPPSLAFSYA